MEMEEEAELHSESPQDEELEERRKGKYRQEAQEVISHVDCSQLKGRQVVAKSYRRINRMIDRIEQDKFK